MRRREFITLLGGVATWPLAAYAEQSDRVRRIGVLESGNSDSRHVQARVTAFQQELSQLGWDHRNVFIEYRWSAGQSDRIQRFAAELVALKPDVILATNTPISIALRQETSVIPVVFTNVVDPVGAGLVASLARPGGNISGFTVYESTIGARWLELLRQLAPQVTRVALIHDPANHGSVGMMRSMLTAGLGFGIEQIPLGARDQAEIDRTITAFARTPNGGLIVLPGPLAVVHRELIIGMAARHRLPAVYGISQFAADGGLVSYGIDGIELRRRAASYVDRILKGEKPGDLPVLRATKFELIINLRTAKALDIAVPPSLLRRADTVIE